MLWNERMSRSRMREKGDVRQWDKYNSFETFLLYGDIRTSIFNVISYEHASPHNENVHHDAIFCCYCYSTLCLILLLLSIFIILLHVLLSYVEQACSNWKWKLNGIKSCRKIYEEWKNISNCQLSWHLTCFFIINI